MSQQPPSAPAPDLHASSPDTPPKADKFPQNQQQYEGPDESHLDIPISHEQHQHEANDGSESCDDVARSSLGSSPRCSDVDLYRLISFYNTAREDKGLATTLQKLWEDKNMRHWLEESTRATVTEDIRALRPLLATLSGGDEDTTGCFQDGTRRAVRIYADGIFDLFHSGHSNAMRQAKALGDKLVVGVVSDQEAQETKGIRPIYTEQERAELMKGLKWVDDVVVGTPYAVTCNFLDSVQCDYVAHGDDFAPCADGTDCYAEPRAAKRMRVFKRTEGISSTRLVSRLLLATGAWRPGAGKTGGGGAGLTPPDGPMSSEHYLDWLLTAQKNTASKQSLMSTRRLMQFVNHGRRATIDDRVVYVDGSFDVFHIGHLRLLQKAKAL